MGNKTSLGAGQSGLYSSSRSSSPHLSDEPGVMFSARHRSVLFYRTAIASTSMVIPGRARELTSNAVEAGALLTMNSLRTLA
jgi:hypothetical protein